MPNNLNYYKEKLEIFKNPQTFKIDTPIDDELVKSIFENISNMEACEIISKFEDCGNPQIANFNLETLSEEVVSKEIKKTEYKIREFEERENYNNNNEAEVEAK
jgi:hypothetical protein